MDIHERSALQDLTEASMFWTRTQGHPSIEEIRHPIPATGVFFGPDGTDIHSVDANVK